ncbi:hypothetical protein EM864_07420, partial [Stenotrophomonas acidaminiphila]|nr:hypothetical protein [Stenotrophomonas acidaminiphila]
RDRRLDPVLQPPAAASGAGHEDTRRGIRFSGLTCAGSAGSLHMMLTLVGAGFGVGFTTETRIATCQRPDVVIRPLATASAVITTYLLHVDGAPVPALLERFIARLRAHFGS